MSDQIDNRESTKVAEAPDKKPPFAKPLTEILKDWEIVAYLTLLTYITTLAFETGFTSYWNVPFELISFTPKNAVQIFLLLAVVGAMSGLAINASTDLEKFGIFLFIVLVLLLIFGGTVLYKIFGGLAIFLFLLILAYDALIVSVIFFSFHPSRFFEQVTEILKQEGLVLVGLLITIPIVALTLGYGRAMIYNKDFLVVDREPELVVIRMYGSTGLCAEFKRGPGKREATLSNGFQLVELSGPNPPKIQVEHLGLLQPYEPEGESP